MAQEKRNARQSDQTRRANQMSENISSKYITPLAIMGGALLAYPVADSLTNINAFYFAAFATLLALVSLVAGSVVENERSL